MWWQSWHQSARSLRNELVPSYDRSCAVEYHAKVPRSTNCCGWFHAVSLWNLYVCPCAQTAWKCETLLILPVSCQGCQPWDFFHPFSVTNSMHRMSPVESTTFRNRLELTSWSCQNKSRLLMDKIQYQFIVVNIPSDQVPFFWCIFCIPGD